MSFFRNKRVKITLLAVVLGTVLAGTSQFAGPAFKDSASRVLFPIEKVCAWMIKPVSLFVDNLKNAENLKKENEKLTAEITELKKYNKSVEDYIKENERLKELLNIRDEMTDKQVLTAQVISVDSDGFSRTITINRGAKDSIKKQDSVVSSLGIVGKVSEVGYDFARITTILSPNHSVGARVTRTNDLAVCEGDIQLVRDGLLKLDYIFGEAQLIEGDIVETSGEGGIYPPGITIGNVVEIKKDNSGRVDYAKIKPATNMDKLYEVLVITDWKRQEKTPDFVELEEEEESQELVQEETLSE